MKTSQHTPGPWTAHDDDGTGTLPCVLSAHVNAGGNFYVAQAQNIADARLIAAAPDLLAALKKWLDAGENENLQATISETRAAIARAEGTK